MITWLFANDQALKTMVAPDPNLRVKLSLASQPFDAEASERIRARAIDALVGGGLPGFGVQALDEAIFLKPTDSTAWYLRGAYYYLTGDRQLAARDLGRARGLEKKFEARRAERHSLLQRFQGAQRASIEEVLNGS